MALKDFYVSIEERYYALMEWLQAHGVPAVDWFVSPIEDKGVPSLPVFVLLIALLGAGAFFVLQDVASPKTSLTVAVLANDEPLAGATVKLIVDDKSFELTTDKKGIAKFTGLPLGKKALVSIRQKGYANYSNEVLMSETQSITALLEPATEEGANRISLSVTNADGQPLEAASVAYADPKSGEVKELRTDATGSALIEFASVSDVFNIRVSRDGFVSERVTCFATQKQCVLTLSPENSKPKDEGGNKPAKGSILVSVEDDAGAQLEGAAVIVHDADSSNVITEGVTDSQGTVFFDSVAVAGTRVFVVVEPPSDAYAGYNGALAQDVQGIASETYVEFRPRLQRKSASDLRNVNVKITGDGGQSVGDAHVRFLMADAPLRELAACDTDGHGECELEVSSRAAGYLTVYADGYLPHVEKSVAAGDSRTIALEALVAGNNGVLDIVVLDADGKRVELASVELVTSDGFCLGVPMQESGYDGFVSFAGLPLEEVKAYATAGALHGYSDIVKVALEAREPLELTLPAPYGRIIVNATDMTTGNLVTATVKAYEEGATTATATCSTGTNPLNSTCSLKVRSDRLVVLKATARGFADYESEQISVENEGTHYAELRMLPNSQAKELQVVDFRIEPLNGAEAVGSLDRGRYYRALLTVNIPGGVERGGGYLRIGDETNLDGEAAYISYFDKPADAEVTWGSTYDAELRCADEAADIGDSRAKWVQQEYSSFGVKTIAAKIFVSGNATRKDKISFHYRAFARRKDVWYRAPEDADLGYAETTAKKEGCRAKTTDVKYDVNEGGSICTESACMIVTFNTTKETGGNGLRVELGHAVIANVQVRVFGEVARPTVRVRSLSGALEFVQANGSAEWSASVALDEAGEGTVATDARAIEPSEFARMRFDFMDADRVLLTDERYVVVEGTGSMVVAVKPATMDSGKKADLTATVFSSTGSAVTDARVAIEEKEGEPFSGEADGDYAIQGDGSEGKGKEGKYAFKRLQPVSPGTFDVVATKQGYREAAATVRVTASDFLSYSPDISALSLGCDGKAITIENALKTDINVSAAFSGTACVSLAGSRVTSAGDDSYTIVIPGGKSTQVVMTPIRSDQCYLVFTATLESTGSTDSQTAWIKVDCPALKKNATAGSEKCSSAECKECNEQQCLGLNKSGGYCAPQYAKTPEGKDAFLSCGQPSPSPSPSPSPNATCSAQRCDLCNETACAVLQNNGSCYANYDMNTHKFTSCVSFRSDQCNPAKFDFSNMLARRLGQYHAQQLFNPSLTSRYVAGSMEDQFVLVPGTGWTGMGCADSGECPISINALFPVGGRAFSVQNTFGSDTTILMKDLKNKKCFNIIDIQRDDLSLNGLIANLQGVVEAGLSSMGVASNQYKNYLVLFNPKEKGCATYYWDNGLHVKPLVDELSITLQSSGIFGTAARTLTFPVSEEGGEDAARYAFMIIPMEGNVYSRERTGSIKLLEPFMFVNNNPELELEIVNVKGGNFVDGIGTGAVSIKPKSAEMAYLNVKAGTKAFILRRKGATKGGLTFTFSKERFTMVGGVGMPGDVIGNTVGGLEEPQNGDEEQPPAAEETDATSTGEGQGFTVTGNALDEYTENENGEGGYATGEALACSGNNYCFPQEYGEAQKAMQEDLNMIFQQENEAVPKADKQSVVKGTLDVFEKALDDAIADYIAQAVVYQACLKLGKDPLKSLKESCSQQLTQPPDYMTPYSQSMYGDTYVPVSNSPTYNFGSVYGDAFSSVGCNSQLLNYAFGASEGVSQQQFWTSFRSGLMSSLYPATGAVNAKEPLFEIDQHVLVPMKRAGSGGGIVLVDFSYDAAGAMPMNMEGMEAGEVVDIIDGTSWDGATINAGGLLFTNAREQSFFAMLTGIGGGTAERSTISFPYVNAKGEVAFDGGTPNCFTANKYARDASGIPGQGCSAPPKILPCLWDESKALTGADCAVTGDEKTLTATGTCRCG